jgi:hypothetical protein
MCVQVTKTANRFEISIFYWFGMVRRKLTIPERWQAVGMHNGGFSHRRVAYHFRVNHSIIVRLMQHFRQTGNVTDRPHAGRPRSSRSHSLMVEASDYSACANVASKR